MVAHSNLKIECLYFPPYKPLFFNRRNIAAILEPLFSQRVQCAVVPQCLERDVDTGGKFAAFSEEQTKALIAFAGQDTGNNAVI